ncbi:MAG: hypothetical protein U9R50_02145 [Campylobacterota bacterium]|nr:hypothetical protein [Campylobacterota bacterium]
MKNTIILLCTLFFSLYADKVLNKKLEVLELMHQDNVKNINTIYYKFLDKEDHKKAEELLLESVNNLNKEALHTLGFKFLANDKIFEALKPLCKASILGSVNAGRDLYLMPMLLNVSNKELESACELAFIDIKTILNMKQNQGNTFKNIRTTVNRFDYDRVNRKMSYYEYLGFLSSKIETLTQEEYTEFILEIEKESSIPRIKKNKRLYQEQLNKQNANWDTKVYLDRVADRTGGATNLLRLNRDSDISLIQDEVNEKLTDFNQLRSDSKKITSEEFWNLVNKQ